jgi:hypothetical protein
VKSKLTLKREAEAAIAATDLLAKLMAEGSNLDATDPIVVLEQAMAAYLRAGNMAMAVSVAEKLAPYRAAKVQSAPHAFVLPEDLQPDAPPTPEPGQGPEGPIIE